MTVDVERLLKITEVYRGLLSYPNLAFVEEPVACTPLYLAPSLPAIWVELLEVYRTIY